MRIIPPPAIPVPEIKIWQMQEKGVHTKELSLGSLVHLASQEPPLPKAGGGGGELPLGSDLLGNDDPLESSIKEKTIQVATEIGHFS